MQILKPGVLVVRRLNWAREFAGSATRSKPSVVLSNEDVRQRYRGFDGEAWPEDEKLSASTLRDDGLADIENLPALRSYYEAMALQYPCDVVLLADPSTDIPVVGAINDFLGFDFGYYLGEGNHFSCLINEILYGKEPELVHFGGALNDHLLFRDAFTNAAYARVRKRLMSEQRDLENDEPCEAVAIYALSNW